MTPWPHPPFGLLRYRRDTMGQVSLVGLAAQFHCSLLPPSPRYRVDPPRVPRLGPSGPNVHRAPLGLMDSGWKRGYGHSRRSEQG